MKISRRNFLKGSATTLFLAGFNFPVLANYKGLQLSTSKNEHVKVEIGKSPKVIII